MDYNITAPNLELLDPNPDIWELFRQFDMQFFEEVLTRNCVELVWSPKMTSCAGVCAWNPRTGFCCIRISLPLLQLRPRKDLVETLLHEMIHGFLFVTHQDDNHESHGNKFHYHMNRINNMTGAKITVYHTFNDEVRNYQIHVWRCNGPCQHRTPYYGYVKRASNRKPGPSDRWWAEHMRTCGGSFDKISEPEVNNKPTVLRLPPPASVPTKRPASTSQAGSGSGPGIKRPAPSSQAGSSKKKPTEVPDSSQKKISDYWSKLGAGRRLCD